MIHSAGENSFEPIILNLSDSKKWGPVTRLSEFKIRKIIHLRTFSLTSAKLSSQKIVQFSVWVLWSISKLIQTQKQSKTCTISFSKKKKEHNTPSNTRLITVRDTANKGKKVISSLCMNWIKNRNNEKGLTINEDLAMVAHCIFEWSPHC